MGSVISKVWNNFHIIYSMKEIFVIVSTNILFIL